MEQRTENQNKRMSLFKAGGALVALAALLNSELVAKLVAAGVGEAAPVREKRSKKARSSAAAARFPENPCSRGALRLRARPRTAPQRPASARKRPRRPKYIKAGHAHAPHCGAKHRNVHNKVPCDLVAPHEVDPRARHKHSSPHAGKEADSARAGRPSALGVVARGGRHGAWEYSVLLSSLARRRRIIIPKMLLES